jgi:signal peptidase I
MATADRKREAGGEGKRVARGEARSAGRAAGRPAPDQRKDQALEWIKSLGIAFVLFLIIRTFLVQTFVITSGSMERTLLVGDFLMISKAAYGARVPGTGMRLPGYSSPKHSDIIIFRAEHEPGMDLVKRIMGVPGDTVEMRARVFYRNGEPVEEPYAINQPGAGNVTHPWMGWQRPYLAEPDPDYRPTLHDWGPLVVPAERYLTLGDNRDDSLDSRYWGFVDAAEIRGEALFIYFSYERGMGRHLAWIREVRWGRIGSRIR